MADDSRDSTRSCPIQKIPLEVLLRISHHLKTPDLGRFRLTCRSIEQSHYNTFTLEFFTRKQFMLTDNSLQALIDISKSRLGSHLRCVYIGLDRFPDDMRRPQPDEEKEIRFRERYANQFSLWNTGTVQKMLAEGFRHLDNLEDVVIRDFNSKRRSRDSPHAEWTSYGSTTILAETGVQLVQRTSTMFPSVMPLQYCGQVFSAVLYSLGEAGAKPRGIEVMSRNKNNLGDFAFMVPNFIEASVLPLLQGLEKLHLCIDLSWRGAGMSHGNTNAVPDLFLRRFLTYTPNLKNLRINEVHGTHPGVGDFLRWMAAPVAADDGEQKTSETSTAPATGKSPAPIHLQHLQVLSLGLMNVEVPQLLGVVRKYAPSLQSLALHKITIVRALPSVDTGEPPKTVFWAGVLEKIKNMPDLNLRHVRMSCLRQQWLQRHAHDVRFKGERPEEAREYTGPDWKHFMEEITTQLHISWPKHDEENDSSASLDDEDSEMAYGEDDADDDVE